MKIYRAVGYPIEKEHSKHLDKYCQDYYCFAHDIDEAMHKAGEHFGLGYRIRIWEDDARL